MTTEVETDSIIGQGYICEGVVGQDVVKLLERSLARYPELSVSVVAILNDTTGCLIACAYKRPDCAVGVIIGTGTNASYVEARTLTDD